jgi:hypothetical protein
MEKGSRGVYIVDGECDACMKVLLRYDAGDDDRKCKECSAILILYSTISTTE